jgi:hypothetical protein
MITDRKYPYFGKLSNWTVLFTKPRTGIVVKDMDNIHFVKETAHIVYNNGPLLGHYDDDWEEELFEPIPHNKNLVFVDR